LSSPFSLIVALFPKENITEAVHFILLLKTGCCGMAFGFFLRRTRNMKLSHMIMFSSMYALCSFAVVMQHNHMWTDNLIALPLIIYAMDELICRGKFMMYTIVLAYAVISNFYIGYMMCIFVIIWYFARYFMLTREERNPGGKKLHFLRTTGTILISSALAIGMAAIIILPTYYSLSFGKLTFSTPDYTPKQLFDYADILSKSFFGSFDTVRPEGMPFIFCGTAALILAPLYFFSNRISLRRKIGFGSVILFFVLSFNLNILDYVWHGFQRPNWLNARFSFMFVCIVLIMAVDAFRNLKEIGFKPVIISAAIWGVVLVIMDKIGFDNLPDFGAVWPQLVLLAVICAVCAAYSGAGPGTFRRRVVSVVLCVLTVAELTANGILMLYGLDEDVVYSTRDSYVTFFSKYRAASDMLKQTDDGFYRAEKLVHRNKNDNYALDLNGLTNSTSTLNAKVIELLQKFGYASRSHWSFYSGATAPSDAIFGIKYVIVDESDKKDVMSYIPSLYKKVGTTEDGLDIYRNPYSLGFAFSVKEKTIYYDIPFVPLPDGSYDEYVDPFTYMNRLLSVMTGEDIKVWTKANLESTESSGVRAVSTSDHKGWKADGSSDKSTVTYTVNVDMKKPIYVYFPSEYPREVTLYLNGVKTGSFFEQKDFSVRELGTFKPGEKVKLELQMKKDSLYIRSGVSYFWYFDEEEFVRAAALLSDGAMQAESEKDSFIKGTVDVPEGDSLMFTTIPYDEGWVVKVDGKEVKKLAVLEESLIAFNITSGHHEITFSYEPGCIRTGWMITLISLGLFIILAAVYLIFAKKKGRSWFNKDLPHPDLPLSDEAFAALAQAEKPEADLFSSAPETRDPVSSAPGETPESHEIPDIYDRPAATPAAAEPDNDKSTIAMEEIMEALEESKNPEKDIQDGGEHVSE
ncbi:MAG: YfhO family protein, partial [Clostridia bacterium]|nr:YfhO family protein [Clostridia bacterium]